MKKFMTAIAVTTMLLTTGGNVLALDSNAASTIDVIATNKKVNFHFQYEGVRVGKPFIENNRTFIPLRVVSEDLGYKVDWNQESQTAIVSKDSNEVKIKIGDNFALVNGVKTYIDIQDGKPVNTRAQLKDSRTYIPVRFISEAMDDKVDYRIPSTSDVDKLTVYINSTNLPVEGPPKPTKPEYKSSTPIKRLPADTGINYTSGGTKVISKPSGIIRYSYTTNLSGGLQIDGVGIYNDIYGELDKNNYGKLGSVGFKDVKNGYGYFFTIKEGYELGSGSGFGPQPNLTSEDYEIIKQAFIQVHNIYKAGK